MAVKLTEDQRKNLKKTFDKYDADKNGQLTAVELYDAFKSAGLPVSKLQIANMMGKYDTDRSGTIDFEEFLAYNEIEASKEKFDEYDKNGDGYLGPDELVNVAKDLNYKSVTPASIKALIDSIDENKDGKISFKEFLSLSAK